MKLPLSFLFILFFFYLTSYCQVGGNSVYNILPLSSSSRITSLGGNLIPVKDGDLSIIDQNPAALDTSMLRHIYFSTAMLRGGITFGQVSYAMHHQKIGLLALSVKYLNYGQFERNDETGMNSGLFNSNDFLLNVTFAKQYTPNLSIGINTKIITSFLEQYQSVGVAVDGAIHYYNPESEFNATVSIRNVGTQLITYTQQNQELLPFDIQAGVSKKLAHLPLRIYLIGHHLSRYDIRYDDPNQQDNTLLFDQSDSINLTKPKKYVGDKILRHFIIGGEFLLSKNVNIRVGYNHLKRREMTIETRRAMVGFSWGFEMKVKKISISYGSAAYHISGRYNHLTISTNLADLIGVRL